MHVLGKVFTWLSVVAALLAVYFGARVLAVRNSWTRNLQALKADDAKNTQLLAENRAELESLRNQLERTTLGWDRYWQGVDGQPTAQGTVEASVGLQDGLDPEAPPLVHGFMLNDDGTSTYAGAFQAVVQQDRTGLAPAWRLRAGDAEIWRAGKWRVRTLVPAASRARFIELETAFTAADQKLVAAQNNLAIQEALLAEAQGAVQTRLGELNGDPQAAAGDPVPPEYTQGLIAALEAEEAARDRTWAEVDRLRRERNRMFQAMQQLDAENEGLTARLPQPPATLGSREVDGP